MTKKGKRFYKLNETVWIIDEKTHGVVNHINLDDLTMTVEYVDTKTKETKQVTDKLWKFDKLKYARKRELEKEKRFLNFAKVKDNARIPKRGRYGDAGYDMWACLEPVEKDGKETHELLLKKMQSNLVPTGIATSVNSKYYLNVSNERGSTGKLGMLLLSGIVDSNYRGEIFVNIVPLFKDVLITSEVSEVVEEDNLIKYPYSKAICQLIPYKLANISPREITYAELQNIPSERGDNALGSSNH